jgi:hypothetical protein
MPRAPASAGGPAPGKGGMYASFLTLLQKRASLNLSAR